jgi:D-tyrosyl-tRNA(Tyr) deacylase
LRNRQNSDAVRALLQRVTRAAVRVDEETVGEIGHGLLALVAAGAGDAEAEAVWTAGKVARLRVFADDQGRMNRSVAEVGGSVLVVSQFTLYADTSRGNRPGFTGAAEPEVGRSLVDRFGEELVALGVPIARGQFGAHMDVELINSGPVTIWLDSGSRA